VTPAAVRSPRRRDLAWTAIALAAVLLWDASGLDLAVSRLFGDAGGFPLRNAWWAAEVLHRNGRVAGASALVAGMLLAWWPRRWGAGPSGPTRAERVRWTLVVLGSLLLVPALKRLSATSCPWDLAEFGGVAAYVSHWRPFVADGGPGHCFPSGHAVAAFQFFGMYFLWRDHRPGWARAWLVGTLLAGAAFGLAQLVRGAHYVSHTLWAAWLCWAFAVAARPETVAAVKARAGALGRRRGGRAISPLPAASAAAAAPDPAAAEAPPTPAPAASRPDRRAAGR
jgi:membrane-associated PAP2 superfamily phosphatase